MKSTSMSNDFQARVLSPADGNATAAVPSLTQQDLPEGDVLVQVDDASIDLASTVIESSTPRVKADWLAPLPKGMSFLIEAHA
jgi:hypothetical protein